MVQQNAHRYNQHVAKLHDIRRSSRVCSVFKVTVTVALSPPAPLSRIVDKLHVCTCVCGILAVTVSHVQQAVALHSESRY